MAEYPNLNIVGEEWSTNPIITSYWLRDRRKLLKILFADDRKSRGMSQK